MQETGNLVLYATSPPSLSASPLWTSGTSGKTGAYAAMQSDGNLVVYLGSTALWWSGTAGTQQAALVMQSDGNAVVYGDMGAGGYAVWASETYQGGAWTPPAANDISSCGPMWSSAMGPGSTLAPGGCLRSPNQQYELFMQTDGNLVLYLLSDGTISQPLWSSNTADDFGYAELQSDGNLVVYDAQGKVDWSSGTSSSSDTLLMQSDGNLVIYDGSGTGKAQALWATTTQAIRGNELLPGQWLEPGQMLESANREYSLLMANPPETGGSVLAYLTLFELQSSVACPLSEWGDTSATEPAPDEFTGTYPKTSRFTLQTDGNLVVYYRSGVIGANGSNASWAANLNGKGGVKLVLGTDGNLVLTNASGAVVWQSQTENYRGTTLCAGERLEPGQYLENAGSPNGSSGGQQVSSDGHSYQLVMAGTGRVILYPSGTAATWQSGTTTTSTPGYAVMQTDGNFVTYSGSGSALWASNSNQSGFSATYRLHLGMTGPGEKTFSNWTMTLSKGSMPYWYLYTNQITGIRSSTVSSNNPPGPSKIKITSIFVHIALFVGGGLIFG